MRSKNRQAIPRFWDTLLRIGPYLQRAHSACDCTRKFRASAVALALSLLVQEELLVVSA